MDKYDLQDLLRGMPRSGRLSADVAVTFGRADQLRPSGLRERVAQALRALADRLDAHESIVMAVAGDCSPAAVQEALIACDDAFLTAVRRSAKLEAVDRQIGGVR